MSTLILKVSNSFTKVEHATALQLKWLTATLSWHVPNHNFIPLVTSGKWDGKKRLFNKRYLRFPTGLLEHMLGKLEEKYNLHEGASPLDSREKVELTLIDERVTPAGGQTVGRQFFYDQVSRYFDGGPIKEMQCDYQYDGTAEALCNSLDLKAWNLEGTDRFPFPRGVFHCATGSGKTLWAAHLLWQLLGAQSSSNTSKRKCLFLVESLSLLSQTRKTFDKYFDRNITTGMYAEGIKEDGDVILATRQTLGQWLDRDRDSAKDFLGQFEVLIVDEAHHIGDNEYHDIIQCCYNSYYRFGFTGTALKRSNLDNAIMVACLGEVVYELPAKTLIEDGILVAPKISMIHCDDGPQWKEAYATAYKTGISENSYRHHLTMQAIEYCVQHGRPTLVLCKQIKHGRNLVDWFSNGKFTFDYVHGKHSVEEREQRIEWLVKNRIDVLIASTIFDEAMDIPQLGAIVMTSGGKSDVKQLQRIGRGLRASEGKEDMWFFDFFDQGNKYLLAHTEQRIAAMEAVGFDWSMVYPDAETSVLKIDLAEQDE